MGRLAEPHLAPTCAGETNRFARDLGGIDARKVPGNGNDAICVSCRRMKVERRARLVG